MSKRTLRQPTKQDAAPDKLAVDFVEHVCGVEGHCTADCEAPRPGSWRVNARASMPANGRVGRVIVRLRDISSSGNLAYVETEQAHEGSWVSVGVLRQAPPAMAYTPKPEPSENGRTPSLSPLPPQSTSPLLQGGTGAPWDPTDAQIAGYW